MLHKFNNFSSTCCFPTGETVGNYRFALHCMSCLFFCPSIPLSVCLSIFLMSY